MSIPIPVMRRRRGGMLGAYLGSGTMLGTESEGVAGDFSDTTLYGTTGLYGTMVVRDLVTPANRYAGVATEILRYTSGGNKFVRGPAGTWGYGPHNLYLNSEAPANQNIAVVNGATYRVTITGTVSITFSGAATGTVTSGTTMFTAATSTLTCGSTSGAGTVYIRRDRCHTDTYLKTTSAARYANHIEWDTNGNIIGAKFEPTSTNLCTYSVDMSNAVWGVVNITRSTVTGIDGVSTSAQRFTTIATALTNCSRTNEGVGSTSGNTYTIFAKKGSGATDLNAFLIRNATTATNLTSITVNYDTGVVTHIIGSGAYTRYAGNGWWRIIIPQATGINAGDNISIYYGATGSSVDAGLYVDLCLPQLEVGTRETSPIRTHGSTLSRGIDKISVSTSSLPFNAAEGMLYVEGMTLFDQGSTTNDFISLTTSPENAAHVTNLGMFSASAPFFSVSETTTQAILDLGTLTLGTAFKMAGTYKANDFAAVMGGGTVQTDGAGSVSAGIASMLLGYRVGSSLSMHGYIKKFMYIPRRVTNTQMQSLTINGYLS